MAREFKISTTPLKEFKTCSNCLIKYDLREASTPRTIIVTITEIGEKGSNLPPFYYCFDCAETDFIRDIKKEIFEERSKKSLEGYKDLSKMGG
jgi:hypothetical protein